MVIELGTDELRLVVVTKHTECSFKEFIVVSCMLLPSSSQSVKLSVKSAH